jgi:hypothetical protein
MKTLLIRGLCLVLAFGVSIKIARADVSIELSRPSDFEVFQRPDARTADGKWQVYEDPQPGAGGRGGSCLPPLGDALANELGLPVGFVSVGDQCPGMAAPRHSRDGSSKCDRLDGGGGRRAVGVGWRTF